MFGALNPKIRATRSVDSTLRWSTKGLSLNLANANNWTGSQSFSSNTNFNNSVTLNSTLTNHGAFYNYGTFYDYGTMQVNNINANYIVATGTVTSDLGFFTQASAGGTFYEFPYAGSYSLSNFPVTPSSISGSSSDGGTLSDDGYGNIYSSYSSMPIASISYAYGTVTDLTYGMVITNNITYSTAASSAYCQLLSNGQVTFTDGINTANFTDGVNALNVTGSVMFDGNIAVTGSINQGAGAPATILTNYNLYVDTVTGLVYVD